MSDALSELLTELSARFAPGADAREVEIYLASRGYDARQIGEIMAAFAAHLDDADGIPANAVGAPSRTGAAASTEGPTFRVLGAHERGRFAPEAWGHLLALTAAGTLAPHDREHLIDRALTHTDGRIGLAELRALLESAGLDDGGSASTTIH
jgi:uncharacterized protein Smg (DUF494 family)